tara:strand:+ start:353 stop:634 length:282 start_codon:yes stop_codon:yes gene_type:complete
MAFKRKPFSGFGNKIKTARAKRLTRKFVGSTTVDGPDTYNISEKKYLKAEKKMMKADKLLKKAGYGLEYREGALGAEGYQTAMDWASKNKKRK